MSEVTERAARRSIEVTMKVSARVVEFPETTDEEDKLIEAGVMVQPMSASERTGTYATRVFIAEDLDAESILPVGDLMAKDLTRTVLSAKGWVEEITALKGKEVFPL